MGHRLMMTYHLEEEYLLSHSLEWVIDHFAMVHRSQYEADMKYIAAVQAGVNRAHAPKARPLPSYEQALGLATGDEEWRRGVWWQKGVIDQHGER